MKFIRATLSATPSSQSTKTGNNTNLPSHICSLLKPKISLSHTPKSLGFTMLAAMGKRRSKALQIKRFFQERMIFF